MINVDVIVALIFALLFGLGAVILLVFALRAILSHNYETYIDGVLICVIFLGVLSFFFLKAAYIAYQDAIPENQAKMLRQKISDAEKAYQKYLIEHPGIKE